MIRVFAGFDSNESVACHVLAHSIMRHAKAPVSITPLVLHQLPMTRKREEYQSTEFSFSRFLVPYLCGYEGMAIFMDGDILARADVAELLALHDPYSAVSVVKHDYTPKSQDKFLGYKQSIYAKKNWSSVMVFNNAMCHALTPQVVNTASGMYLHQFHWLQDESMIGSLPIAWNCLIDEENQCPVEKAKLLHFSRGGPWFKKFADCEGSKEWFAEKDLMLYHNPIGEYSINQREAA